MKILKAVDKTTNKNKTKQESKKEQGRSVYGLQSTYSATLQHFYTVSVFCFFLNFSQDNRRHICTNRTKQRLLSRQDGNQRPRRAEVKARRQVASIRRDVWTEVDSQQQTCDVADFKLSFLSKTGGVPLCFNRIGRVRARREGHRSQKVENRLF